MSQNAIVKQHISSGVVQIALMREAECGNGCKHCDICLSKPPEDILTTASDPIGVEIGEWVEVELEGTTAIAAAMLIYLLPCITLLGGYILGELFGLGVVPSLFCAALGLVLGFVPARLVNRSIQNRETPEFTIVKRKI